MKCRACSREIEEREFIDFETGLCESCFEDVLRAYYYNDDDEQWDCGDVNDDEQWEFDDDEDEYGGTP